MNNTIRAAIVGPELMAETFRTGLQALNNEDITFLAPYHELEPVQLLAIVDRIREPIDIFLLQWLWTERENWEILHALKNRGHRCLVILPHLVTSHYIARLKAQGADGAFLADGSASQCITAIRNIVIGVPQFPVVIEKERLLRRTRMRNPALKLFPAETVVLFDIHYDALRLEECARIISWALTDLDKLIIKSFLVTKDIEQQYEVRANDVRKMLSVRIYDFLSLLLREEIRSMPLAQKAFFQLGVYRQVPVGSQSEQGEERD